MNLNSEKNKLLVKYALLLTVLYAVQFLVGYLLTFLYDKPADNIGYLLKGIIPLIVIVIGNLITMWFVIKDKNKFQIQNRYLVILTFCIRPVGVCILLIQVILKSSELNVEIADIDES